MHLNTFFLRLLAPALGARLAGMRVATCFSQEKDELVIGLADEAGQREAWVRAVLTGQPTALSFPDEFRRARVNSVDLFPELLGRRVEAAHAHFGERSLHLTLTGGWRLLFKLHGARANVVLFPPPTSAQAPILFRRRQVADAALSPEALAAVPVPATPTDLGSAPATTRTLPKFYGDLPARWLRARAYDDAPEPTQAALWTELNAMLLSPLAFYLLDLEGVLRLSLLPLPTDPATASNDAIASNPLATRNSQPETPDPVAAAQAFSQRFRSTHAFAALYARAHRHLTRQAQAAEQATTDISRRLRHLETDASYRQTADIVMANLTNIPPGATEVELYDFYQDITRPIKLKKGLSPQRAAEDLYRKAKNQQLEVAELRTRLGRYEDAALRALDLLPALEALEAGADFRILKSWLRDHQLLDALNQTKAEAALPATPFKEFTYRGFRILVGRSAQNNDELTLRHARKDDLWLHAKDVAGSHVVIRAQPGAPFPKPVIEAAAQLAAWYSKRKSDTLCPVIVTPRKYVRKPRGAAAGSVRVEREQQVLLVRPANPFEREGQG